MSCVTRMTQSLWGLIPSDTSPLVRSISIVSLGIGLLFLFPVALLIIFDIVVWLWRTSAASDLRHEAQRNHQTGQAAILGSQGDKSAGPSASVRSSAPGRRHIPATATSQET
ncbi:hypothetical protein VUR80DRAFT_10015 [Thermomyces stellatus]